MRNPLHKRIFRLLWHKPGTYLPLFLMFLFSTTFLSAFFIAQNSIEPLYYQQLEEGKVEDGQILMMEPLSDTSKKAVEADALSLYENFYKEQNFGDDTHNDSNMLRIFKNRRAINLAMISEGRLPEKNDEMAVNANLALVNGYKIGDRLRVGDRDWTLVGFVSTPDYSTVLKNPTDLVMDAKYFGLGFVTDAGFDAIRGTKTNYLYSYRLHDTHTEEEARDLFQDALTRAAHEGTILSAMNRYDNPAIRFFIDDMGGDVPMMGLIMVLMFLALAFMTTMQTRGLVQEEAPVIGTLLASGYSRKSLLVHYTLLPFTMTLLAAVFGNLIAYAGGYKLYADLYYESYALPKFKPLLTLHSFCLTTLVPLCIVTILNVFILLYYLRLSPLRFLRSDISKRSKGSHRSLRHVPFLMAFRLRVLWEHRANVLALFFGLFIGNMLLLYGVEARTMFSEYGERVKSQILYNYTYIVKQPVPAYDHEQKALLTELDYRIDEEKTKKDTAIGAHAFAKKAIMTYALDKGSRYHADRLDALKENEIIISRGMADKYHIAAGDAIAIKTRSDAHYTLFNVKDVFDDVSEQRFFMPMKNLNRFLKQPDNFFNTYLSDRTLSFDPENVLTRMDREKINDYMEHFIEGFSGVFVSVLILALVFYFVLVTTVSRQVLDKSRRNITYLKVFGYHDDEIARIYLHSLLFAMPIFYIVTLPLFDRLLTFCVQSALTKLGVTLHVYVSPARYAILFLIGFALFLLVQLFERFRLRKIDMVKELKVMNG